MKVSLNEIKKYVPEASRVATPRLIELIGARLVEVEDAEDWGKKYAGIYIVKVMECEAIPDTHLHLCKIDAGAELNQQFGESSDIQVVCGAPNVHAGMWAVWIAPGSIVPETYGGENFALGSKKLRGYMSHGMLSALDELDLGTDHAGIVELDTTVAGIEWQAGDSFAEKFGLNDVILDIENKSLTHRPDAFGLIGFAREVAGILGVRFKEPTWLVAQPDDETLFGSHKKAFAVDVKITDAEICPRYTCAVLEVADIDGPTGFATQLTPEAIFLAKAGMRSISPVVDMTNILMLQTGQPLHAFDYDKIVKVGGTTKAQIGVRLAYANEKIELLDGKIVTCNEDDIVITSADCPVALAGAMGGKNTEVDAGTKRIILESATFSLYNLRKTQMNHGIFSEAITRFTKGQPAGMTLPVLAQAVTYLQSKVKVKVLNFTDEYLTDKAQEPVKLTLKQINSLLGTDYDSQLVMRSLQNVGFTVEIVDDSLCVSAPFWRTDIHIPEDVIEEIGRLNGYDNIPQTLPMRPFRLAQPEPMLKLKTKLRNLLSDVLGAHEVLTYSFVSGKVLKAVGENVENSYQIVNSISPELQYFRQSLTTSLLTKIPQNVKAGYDDFAIYEINQISQVDAGLTEENVPVMEHRLALLATQDFYTVKDNLLTLAQKLGVTITLQTGKQILPQYEPKRSAEVYLDGQKLGVIGEIKISVLRNFKLKRIASGYEINLTPLLSAKLTQKDYTLSRFPTVTRDLTLKITQPSTTYQKIFACLQKTLAMKELHCDVEPVSIYQPENTKFKHYSFRITFTSYEKTLASAEISAIMEKVARDAGRQLGAEVV